jgi:short-subunit dehydrogenase
VDINLASYGPWVVIVGGSEGLGLAIAKEAAAQAVDLVIVGRRPDVLTEAKEQLQHLGSKVRCVEADMATGNGVEHLIESTSDLEVGTVVYNVGVGEPGAYKLELVECDVASTSSLIALSTTSLVATSQHFGHQMKDRRRGALLVVGSFSGLVGSPGAAVYAASKAFSRLLSEGLWYELRPYGVHVMHYLVSSVQTPAMDRLGVSDNGKSPAHYFARDALAHLADGPIWVSDGELGLSRAEALNGFPRGQIVEAMAEGLANSGLYKPPSTELSG